MRFRVDVGKGMEHFARLSYRRPGRVLAGDLVFAQRLVTRVRETSAEVALGFPGVKTDATGAHVLRLELLALLERRPPDMADGEQHLRPLSA